MNLAVSGNKGAQPAVLLLLPFTNNDAALSQPEPMVPPGTPGDDRSRTRDQLPMLTSNLSKTQLPRRSPFSLASSSSVANLDSLTSFRTRNHTTEVLHSDPPFPTEDTSQAVRELNCHATKENVHSRNDSSLHNLRSVAPTLRRYCHLEALTSSAHLPKPTFEPATHPRLPTSRSYFRNSLFGNLNNGELSSYWTKRMKVHVTDLPRSHTPVSDNDPDKLNMKNVIAFLQSNSKIKVMDESVGHGIVQEEIVAKSSATQRHSSKSTVCIVGEDNLAFLNQKQKTLKPNFYTTRREKQVCKSENTPNFLETSESEFKNARTRNHTVSRESNVCDQENVQRVPAKSQVHEDVISPNASDNCRCVESKSTVNNLPGAKNKSSSNISQQINTNVRIFPVHRYNLAPIVRTTADNTVVDVISEPKNVLYISQKQRTKPDIVNEDSKRSKQSTPKGRRNSNMGNSSRFSSSLSSQPLPSSEKAEGKHPNPDSSQNQQTSTSVIFLPCVHPELESDEELPCIPQKEPEEEQSDEQTSPAKVNDKVNTARADCVSLPKIFSFEAQDKQTDAAFWKIPTHLVTTTETFESVKTDDTAQTNVSVDRKDQTCLSGLNSQSTFSDKNSSSTGNTSQSSFSTSSTQDRQDNYLKSFQLDAHQRTFIRLVNQELASLRQTKGRREHASALLWTLSYQNSRDIVYETDNAESPPEHVRLSLRKERDKTRTVTYLTDLEEFCRKQ